MIPLSVQSTRSGIVESTHRVSLAVCDGEGNLVASSGDVDLRPFMRSAAKPFQALPLVEDGVVQRFDLSDEELALTCASHSAEPRHVEIVRRLLDRLGLDESQLACGPHRPLSRSLADQEEGVEIEQPPRPWTPVTSNCSGKHTGMLALALHRGWPTDGYQKVGHPVQVRVEQALLQCAAVAPSDVARGVDGCGVVSFAMPLIGMARAFAVLVADRAGPAATIVRTMTSHGYLIGGTGRPDSELMEAYSGQVLAKVGAEGVYGAALVDRGLGIALKVEDGNAWAAVVALVAVLEQLGLDPTPSVTLPQFAERPVLNTRGILVGAMKAVGEIEMV